MEAKKHNDPFWWTLFGAGGTLSAFFLPVHVVLLGLAVPLGWIAAPDYSGLLDLASLPVAKVYLFTLISLSLFHWAHRFRYTLYDGLQLKHLESYILVFCYGSAVSGTVFTGLVLFGL